MQNKSGIFLTIIFLVMPVQAWAINQEGGRFIALRPTDDARVDTGRVRMPVMPQYLPIQPQMRAQPQPVKLIPLPQEELQTSLPGSLENKPQKKAAKSMSEEEAKLLLFIFNQSE